MVLVVPGGGGGGGGEGQPRHGAGEQEAHVQPRPLLVPAALHRRVQDVRDHEPSLGLDGGHLGLGVRVLLYPGLQLQLNLLRALHPATGEAAGGKLVLVTAESVASCGRLLRTGGWVQLLFSTD